MQSFNASTEKSKFLKCMLSAYNSVKQQVNNMLII